MTDLEKANERIKVLEYQLKTSEFWRDLYEKQKATYYGKYLAIKQGKEVTR